MYLTIGVILLIAFIVVIGAIVFIMIRTIKKYGEFTISKVNLVFLIPTFMLLYLLHLTAWKYNGGDWEFFNLFSLIGTSFSVLSEFTADTDLILPISQAYPIYYVNFAIAYLTGFVTVVLSVASFFGQRIRNYFAVIIRFRRGCDIVVGDCSDSIEYIKNNKNSLLLVENIPRDRYVDLLKEGVVVKRSSLAEVGKKLKRKEFHIILFSGSNISYTKIIDEFINLKKKGCKELKENDYKITLNLQAEEEEVKVIKEKFISKIDKEKLNDEIKASVNCFSKHDLIARHFVVDYPISKYIPRSFFNKNLTLKQDKKINVVFVGFGKMNYQLFKLCATQFQFATQQGDKLVSKIVNYYIYDNKESALHNEYFSKILYEFDENFKDCDFPKPDKVCNLEVKHCDINSVEAKKHFKELVTDKSFTYFIVSLNNDLVDASYAESIKRLLDEEKNYRIFVRAKNNTEKLNSKNDKDNKIIYFGQNDVLYKHESIVNDDLFLLAQLINKLYVDIESSPEWENLSTEKQNEERLKFLKNYKIETILNNLKEYKNKEEMRKKRDSLITIDQASNFYHALNLPFKLGILGFNMVKVEGDEGNPITEEQFNQRYINTGKPSYSDCKYFFKTEVANVLAFIEHSRWNALYIFNDYKQMKKSDMKVTKKIKKDGSTKKGVDHKNHEIKQHACVTTYYGLKDLVDFKFSLLYPDEDITKVATTDSRLRELYQIYEFDYMSLDRLYSEITALGYKLVDKTS